MSRSALLFSFGIFLTVACGGNTTSDNSNPCATLTDANCDDESTTIDATNSSSGPEADPVTENSHETVEEVIRHLPLSCFIGSSKCDPRNGNGCEDGETCDFSSESELNCYPPPNTAAIDETCNNSGGPYCASGGWCAPDSITGDALCHQVCCSDSECSAPGTKCVGVFTDPNIGSLGLCRIPSDESDENNDSGSCLPPGASCSPANDQCCNYCHSGHCH